MASEIKTKLTLEGEKEYKSQLDAAYSSLRVLRSELKAETAEMGRNASAQEKARAKADSLRKQIAEQEKVVAALNAALEQAKTQYADNQEVQDKWQEKLNNARTVLANMKNNLESCSSGMNSFTNSVKDVDGDTGSAVQGVVDLGDALGALKDIAGSIASAIGNAFIGMLDNVRDSVDIAWDLVSGAMSAAHEWTGLQEMYGGKTEDIAQFIQTAAHAGVDTSTVTSAVNKLISKTHNGDSELFDLLKEWGIEENQFTNHWEYFDAVWEKMMEVSGGDQNKVYKYAETLFGDRNGGKIASLVNNWARGVEEYNKDNAETGLSWSQEALDDMNTAYNKVEEIKLLWNDMKDAAGITLWYTVEGEKGADLALEALRDVAKLFTGTGDKDEITKKLVLDVQAIFDWATAGIGSLSTMFSDLATSFQESDDPTMKSIGNLLESISNFLQWVVDNSALIISALQAWVDFKIADFQTGGFLSGVISELQSIGGNIVTLLGIQKLTSAGKEYVEKASGGGLTAVKTWFANTFGGAEGLSLLAPIATIGAWMMPAIIAAQNRVDNPDTVIEYDEYVQAATDTNADLVSAINEWVGIQNQILDDAYGDMSMSPEQKEELNNRANELYELFSGSDLWQRYWDNHTATDGQNGGMYKTLDELGIANVVSEAETAMQNRIASAMSFLESRVVNYNEQAATTIANKINGVTVQMDGVTVGRLVAPYVDEIIGAAAQ